MKSKITKSVLGAALVVSISGTMPTAAQAQTRNSRAQTQAVADEQKRTGITTFYYAHKSNAVGKLNAEQRRGKYARMYYSDERRQWAVDVGNGLATGGGGSGTTATTTTRPPSVADEQRRTGITTFYYAHKSNAVGKLNAEQKRGKYARMYYSDERRQWAVDVSNGLSAGTSTPTRPTATSAPARPDLSADGGNLPNGASVIYFPTRESAEGIYKASQRQGDWAKMWYDAKRRQWAVAVKPR